jgi:Dolichyl-phosphate-mannose-protein mannosyltransferase
MERSPLDDAARCARLFWMWLVARTVVWFGAVAVVQPNPLQDLVESLAWGHHLAWGYPKQPPLTSWLAEAFSRLSPGDVWPLYLAGYLAAALGLWAVWRVACAFLSPRAALFAVVGLDGLIYLTGEAAEFNNNIALCALWSLAVLCFIRATQTGMLRWWLALGVIAGLGLLCKYPVVFLLAALGGYSLFDRAGRRHLKSPGPYLSVLVAAAVFAPHVVWLAQHNFLPFHYAAARASSTGPLGHITQPSMFLISQLVKFLPVLAVLAPLLGRRNQELDHPAVADRALLHWSVIGPFALLLTYSLIAGAQLRDRWGAPFVMLASVWVLAAAGSTTFSPIRLRRAATLWAAISVGFLAIWVGRLVVSPYVEKSIPRACYPGRQLAEEVAQRWHARRSEPIPIVAGEAWRASNVCSYAPHGPIIYSSGDMGLLTFDPHHAFWTDDADLSARGGVIVWGAYQLGDTLPAWIRQRFPNAEVQPPIVLPYQTGAQVRPDRIGVAFVWPADDQLAHADKEGSPRRR